MVKSFHVWIFKTMSFYIFQRAESKAWATWQCVFIGMCYSIVFTSVFVRKYFSPRVTRVHKRSLAWDNVVDSHADPWNFISLEWFADYRNSGNDERFRIFHAWHMLFKTLYPPPFLFKYFCSFFLFFFKPRLLFSWQT